MATKKKNENILQLLLLLFYILDCVLLTLFLFFIFVGHCFNYC